MSTWECRDIHPVCMGLSEIFPSVAKLTREEQKSCNLELVAK